MEKSSWLARITKILVIGGAIILFILLAYFIIRWVPKAITGIANIGSSVSETFRGADEIEVFVNDSEIENEMPVLVSWDYTPKEKGSYVLNYSCEDRLIFDIQSSNGAKRILCNTNFNLGENLKSISLVPVLTKSNSFVDATVNLSFVSSDNKKLANGYAVITVKNLNGETGSANPFNATNGELSGSSVSSSPVENTNTGNQNNTNTNTNTRGTAYTPPTYTAPTRADLAIANPINLGSSGLAFTVYNYGGTATGNWYFTYTDAENPSRTLLSPIQPSLGPGQGILTRVQFDNQDYSPQNITIFVDSQNFISESNESNNVATIRMTGRTSGGSSNNGNYNNNDDADFVIEGLEVGRMSGSRFVKDDEIDEDDDAAVRFTVRNKGGKTTNGWRFEITNTPYNNNDDYRSGRYNSLRPGEEIEIIIEFNNPDRGTYNIRVEVDSDDDTNEESERNNTKSKRLEVNR